MGFKLLSMQTLFKLPLLKDLHFIIFKTIMHFDVNLFFLIGSGFLPSFFPFVIMSPHFCNHLCLEGAESYLLYQESSKNYYFEKRTTGKEGIPFND